MEEKKENLDINIVKVAHDNNKAVINGRDYHITKTNHAKRRLIFAFFSSVSPQMEKGNYSFLGTQEYLEIEKILDDMILFDGELISRLKDHWDRFPEDYLSYVTIMLGAISYPFLKGVAGA